MFDPIDIIVTDPRDFDGNPYEVADRALAQVDGAIKAAEAALDAAFLMARNADMERNLALGRPPAGSEYAEGPQGRRLRSLGEQLTAIRVDLGMLRRAASFDPKHPPKV